MLEQLLRLHARASEGARARKREREIERERLRTCCPNRACSNEEQQPSASCPPIQPRLLLRATIIQETQRST